MHDHANEKVSFSPCVAQWNGGLQEPAGMYKPVRDAAGKLRIWGASADACIAGQALQPCCWTIQTAATPQGRTSSIVERPFAGADLLLKEGHGLIQANALAFHEIGLPDELGQDAQDEVGLVLCRHQRCHLAFQQRPLHTK